MLYIFDQLSIFLSVYHYANLNLSLCWLYMLKSMNRILQEID